ncbi:ArsR/SmtB family transcription factor [Nonomuraea soli]|uniref:DNA-binding transcriptional ArsR family regulator n=1 Tax=Nonomuraea soli TaxID=1032476 RepID=A0A7W0HW55_9ACTN|nr:DUF5937 family protein [Nonomuraea soli]MBA2897850.1 DNA-binding transcriptional ArsR family regulator [Nonomuraea soli]
MPTVITGLDRCAQAGKLLPAVSALTEFGSALHVLRDPGHHGLDEWAGGILTSMSPRLAAWTRSWWWTAQAIRATPFVTPTTSAESFTDRLEHLRALPAQELASQLLRPIAPTGDRQVALRWSRSRGAAVEACVEALARRPQEAAEDFLAFLRSSWQEWFEAEWARIRPVLAGRARRFADLAALQGPGPALAALDSSVEATPTGVTVHIAKVRAARHDVSKRGLVVAPSTFIRPHLYVADVPGRPLLLLHPADAGPAVPSAAVVRRRLEALAHQGRLEVARAIATEPRTAGEIAMLWNVDPTQVNRHLRALAAAGLATTARQGRFVRYRLATDVLEELGKDVLSLLLR